MTGSSRPTGATRRVTPVRDALARQTGTNGGLSAAAFRCPRRARPGLCAAFTVEEVGEAFGEPVIAEPNPDGCSWYSEDTEGGFVFVSTYWDSLPMAERQASMPEGALTVAGRDAYYAPDYFTLYIQPTRVS